jgi:6-pyruvoyltetrahydropterin/6-carboxytetrahydropterin synthase
MIRDVEEKSRGFYAIAIRQDFIAQHYLIGDALETEKERHSHCYRVEVELEGSTLNEQGYLVDIVEVESHLKELLACYQDKTLNELPEFRHLNPSIEHFARILCQALLDRLKAPHLNALTIRVWEGANAWALYRQDLSCASV